MWHARHALVNDWNATKPNDIDCGGLTAAGRESLTEFAGCGISRYPAVSLRLLQYLRDASLVEMPKTPVLGATATDARGCQRGARVAAAARIANRVHRPMRTTIPRYACRSF